MTVDYDDESIAVDTGFIVYNELNYPDFTQLLAHPNVETVASCMSFSLSADKAVSSGKAAALYFGKVMHARLKPMGHRFAYRVMNLLSDLDRLDDVDRMSKLFGVNRPALYSSHEKDHGPRDGNSMRAFAQRLAAARGIDLADGKVSLLCYPRLLGHAFNPLSVCWRPRSAAGGGL